MAKGTKRKRYCDIKATSLEEVLETCNRHISNINKTQADYIAEGDGTSTDDFYCDMFRQTWTDLREDVQAILASQQNTPKIPTEQPVLNTVFIVEHVEFERGWGQRPDGYTAHKSLEAARAYGIEKTKGYTGPAPDCYVQYYPESKGRLCSPAFWAKFEDGPDSYVYFDKLEELNK